MIVFGIIMIVFGIISSILSGLSMIFWSLTLIFSIKNVVVEDEPREENKRGDYKPLFSLVYLIYSIIWFMASVL